MNNAFRALKKDGVFIIEVQYLLDTLKDVTFDNIYHEHVNYWSVTSLKEFCNLNDLKLIKVEHVETHGGSIRAYISNDTKVDSSVEIFLNKEKDFGISQFRTYEKFASKVKNLKTSVLKTVSKIKKEGNSIVGYGSPAKATTVLNYYGISYKDIDYIIEDNELKHNHLLPGMKIPIKSKKANQKIASIGSYERPRIAGKKKVNAIRDGFLILKYMIYLFFNLKFNK